MVADSTGSFDNTRAFGHGKLSDGKAELVTYLVYVEDRWDHSPSGRYEGTGFVAFALDQNQMAHGFSCSPGAAARHAQLGNIAHARGVSRARLLGPRSVQAACTDTSYSLCV